ncbi:type II toxin-antitoxin system RatA family toxin [Sorangium sp. So ce131]|uniref:type II toxin-antitoxin system RatA family toxin n=1 Tax=Sorangium sp. So ce131 TaxID=3133282 RepID=UPI003F612658
MPTIQSTAEIDAPARDLFVLSQDYGLRLEWDPFVRELRYCDGAAEPAVGVRVWVRAKNGLAMVVRYITVNPPEQVAIALVEGPPVFRQFSGAWLFKALAPRRTQVTFRYHFAARPRILAPVLEPVMKAVLRRDIDERLAGLKRSAETTDILQRIPRRDPITA